MEYNQATRGGFRAVIWIELKALFLGEKGGSHFGNE